MAMGLVASPAAVNAAAPAAAALPAFAAGDAEADIDAFWQAVFEDSGIAYATPSLVGFDAPITTGGCGDVAPQDYTSFYCEVDDTVYYSIPSVSSEYDRFGDAGWVHMMAHEWGHHIQLMLGIIGPDAPASDLMATELQATCLAGVYVADAAERDLVTSDAITVMLDMLAGDYDHGTREALLGAFDQGYENGLAGCGVTF